MTSLKVFIAEDSPSVLKALNLLLECIPQVQVIGSAERAPRAAELIEKLKPDVAFLDFSLAEGSGLDVLKQIKPALPAIIAIILTSHDDRWIRAKCKAAGADHFLSKSSDFEKIPDLLRQILREKELGSA